MPNKFVKGCWPWQQTPNPLITHDLLGSTKPVVNPLPPDKHSYGDKVPENQCNTREVIYSIQQHNPTKDRAPTRDMIALNKACIGNSLSTAPQFYAFRKGSSQRHAAEKGSTRFPIVLPEEGFVYGKREKPENTKLLMTNAFMEAQAEQNMAKYCQDYVNSMSINPKLSFYKTKSHHMCCTTSRSRMRDHRRLSQVEDPMWKLSRFIGPAKSKIKDGVEQHRKRYMSQKREEDKERRGCAFP